MFQVLLLIVPFGLAGAVSPVLLTEQTVLLAGPDGRRAGKRFALGAFLVLVAYIGLLVFFGRAISFPKEPSLDATLDVALGLLLIAISLTIRRGRESPGDHPKEPGREKRKRTLGSRAALGFGAFSMATNFTTLALVLPGAKAIAAGGLDFPERFLLVLILAGLAAAPAWLPVVLTEIAPGPAQRGLSAIGELIQDHGRQLTVVLLGGLGLLLVLRGILHAAGL